MSFRHAIAFATLTISTAASASPIFNGNKTIPGLEASGMQVLYEFNVSATNPGYRNGTHVPYTVNNLASVLSNYSRVGYYVEVTSGPQKGQFVYVSMDAFEQNAAKLAVPHNWDNPVTRQTFVANASIYSNNGSIVQGTGINTVSLEMWSSNYGTEKNGYSSAGNGGTFDFNDGGFNNGAGHGSFQIHNVGAGQTLFGWNDWGGNSIGAASEFGIGNAPGAHPDWTFSDSAQAGLIQIVVGTPSDVPEPMSLALFGLGAAGLAAARRRKGAKAA